MAQTRVVQADTSVVEHHYKFCVYGQRQQGKITIYVPLRSHDGGGMFAYSMMGHKGSSQDFNIPPTFACLAVQAPPSM